MTAPMDGYVLRASYTGGEEYLRPDLERLAAAIEARHHPPNIRPLATTRSGKTIIVQAWWAAWWSICDNGGELNVEKINHGETMRSIPYRQSALSRNVPLAVLARWCEQVIRGEPITDWDAKE